MTHLIYVMVYVGKEEKEAVSLTPYITVRLSGVMTWQPICYGVN